MIISELGDPALQFDTTSLPGLIVLTPTRNRDQRGFFAESYGARAMTRIGVDIRFVQDNHAHSDRRHTIRGLHFQMPPHAQAKLVYVVRGAIFDVAVDLRHASPTYGRHFAVELSAENGKQLFVPVGFAHGLCTLTDETDVIYKVSDYYSRAHERGIRWCDPALDIAWPAEPAAAIISDRDRSLPMIADLQGFFRHDA